MGRPTKSPVLLFWSKVELAEPDQCWLWKASCWGKYGEYGKHKFEGKVTSAHRVAYMLAYGPIPDGLDVCHQCDNPLCCNPQHLWLGTARQNILDMLNKGRSRYPASKLTPEQVIEMRRLLAKGYQGKIVAKMFGVNELTVSTIKNRKSWKHLPQPDDATI